MRDSDSLAEALAVLEPADREMALSLLGREGDETPAPRKRARYRGVHPSLIERDTYYAFQVDDIKLLKEASLVGASVTGLVVLGKAPVGVIGMLAVLLYRYRRRRVRLTAEEGIVLLALKRAPRGGMTVEDLARDMLLMTESELSTILARLQSIEREDGTTAKLADHTEQRWRAVDV